MCSHRVVYHYNRRFNGAERDAWPVVAQVWSMDGQHYCGCLKYHVGRGVLSAWCTWRRPGQRECEMEHKDWGTHGICRLDRTTRGEVHRGRPVSMLVAWLHRGCGCVDRPQHLLASKRVPKNTRLRVRDWVESKPEICGAVLALERPRERGEPREHDRSA